MKKVNKQLKGSRSIYQHGIVLNLYRIIKPYLFTLDINYFCLITQFPRPVLCQFISTHPRIQHMLKLSHGALGKHPGNPIQHVLFIIYPPNFISSFSKKLPILLRFKAKGKARIGVVDLFFSHIILHPFILIKECMSFLSIPLYLSYLTQPIHEHLGGFDQIQ